MLATGAPPVEPCARLPRASPGPTAPLSWRCQPTKPAPSYSSSSAQRSAHQPEPVPGGTGWPRRNAAASIGGAAGRLHAGQPQRAGAAGHQSARSSSTVPGAPDPSAGAAASIFSVSPPSSGERAGHGSNARTWRSIDSAGLRPVDPAVLARQFRRVGDAVSGCGTGGGCVASTSTISRAPSSASASCRVAAVVVGVIGTARAAASRRCRGRRPSA